MNRTASDETAIRDLIQRYKICWEVWPEQIRTNAHLEQTGFELELLGTHPEGTGIVSPGCDACVEVYEALRQVAAFILPDNTGLPTRYEIEPFEPALRYSSTRKNRPDVLLEIKIVHRQGFGPVDECEKKCVREMQTELDRLGAYRGCWAPDPNYPSRKYKGGLNEKRYCDFNAWDPKATPDVPCEQRRSEFA